MTTWTDLRRGWLSGGPWGVLDTLGHMIGIPHWAMGWICERYDHRLIGDA